MNDSSSSRPSWPYIILAVVAAILIGTLAWAFGRQAGLAQRAVVPSATPASPTEALLASAPTATDTPTPTATATGTPTRPTATPSPTPTSTPTPTPTSTPQITALPPLPQSFLITARQPVQVVKTYDASPTWWPNFPPFDLVRGRFTLVATGVVSAGVDFRQVKPENVHRLGDSIQIKLPAPVIYEPVSLDMSETYIIDQPGIKGQDLNKVIQAQGDTVGQMEDWSLKHGILADARTNAEQLTELWLRRLGFTKVQITWEPAQPNQ